LKTKKAIRECVKQKKKKEEAMPTAFPAYVDYVCTGDCI
jgi:hypothetical protein